MKSSAALAETLHGNDARADEARREISLAREHILIRRRLQGIAMTVDVPANAYRGVVLSLVEAASGKTFYRISLLHRDPDLSVALEEALDDHEIVANWKAWAQYFALPKFIEREPGHIEGAECMLGALTLGRGWKLRRRGATIAKRRPRASLRRKVGFNQSFSRIISGEPTIPRLPEKLEYRLPRGGIGIL